MKRKIFYFVIFLMLFTSTIIAQVPKWSTKLPKDVKIKEVIGDEKYLFLSSYKYSSLYDLENGKQIYELKLNDYEDEGLHNLIGNYFVISVKNELHCYDVLTGKQIWKQEYNKIKQDKFKSMNFVGDNMMLRYDNTIININLSDGVERYRFDVKFNQDILEYGGWNWTTLEKYKYLVIFDNEKNLLIYNYLDGKQILKLQNIIVNTDVAKNYDFFYSFNEGKYIVITLKDAISIIDIENLKEIYRVNVKYNLENMPIMPTDFGFISFVENKILVFNKNIGKLSEIPVDVNDFKTYYLTKINDKDILIISLYGQMLSIDVSEAKVLWISKKDDPNFGGFVHSFIKTEGENIIFIAANKGAKFSISTPGTDIFAVSLNALNGNVNYKSKALFHSWRLISEAEKKFAKFMGKTFGTMGKIINPLNEVSYSSKYTLFSSEKREKTLRERAQEIIIDKAKIPFEYTTYLKDNKLIVAVVTSQKMESPVDGSDNGEGVVIIDINNGNLLYSDYVQLNDYVKYQPNKYKDMAPYLKDNILVLAGNKKIAAYDLEKMKRLVLSDEVKGLPREAFVADNTLFFKFGEYKFNILISPPKNIFIGLGMDIKKEYNEDPYGFIAFDLNTGKKLWRIETDSDPAYQSFGFSIEKYYDAKRKRLYFGDKKKIYALQFRPDGGKYDYVLDLANLNLGNIPLDESFVIVRRQVGGIFVTNYSANMFELSYKKNQLKNFLEEAKDADSYIEYYTPGLFWATVWGASAYRRLGFVVYDDKMLVMGTKAIGQYDLDSGKEIWKTKWDYNQKEFQFAPDIINDKLVFCLNRKFQAMDLDNGKILWENKEEKWPVFIQTNSGKYMLVYDEENVRVYEI